MAARQPLPQQTRTQVASGAPSTPPVSTPPVRPIPAAPAMPAVRAVSASAVPAATIDAGRISRCRPEVAARLRAFHRL